MELEEVSDGILHYVKYAGKQPYKRHAEFSLKVLVAILCVAVIGFIYSPLGFKTCDLNPYQRQESPDSKNFTGAIPWYHLSATARSYLFFWGVRLIYFMLLVGFIYCSNGFADGLRKFVAVALVFGLYFVFLPLCEHLKAISADQHCTLPDKRKGNGVSGHTFYSAYVTLCIHYLCLVLWPKSDQRHQVVRYFFTSLSVIFTLQMLITTYVYGYHSPQQMVAGFLMGSVSQLIVLIPVHWVMFAEMPFTFSVRWKRIFMSRRTKTPSKGATTPGTPSGHYNLRDRSSIPRPDKGISSGTPPPSAFKKPHHKEN
eukprot:comp15592_c1_seq1/m.12702 comp15592_c1_seq1/g.12702  ORF comp15592_c1_seq1/g.12702 comp15592_c1_seq1/m.12702 type:complete len:313 (-) comp15592_c1_seq1:441-1379(-)